MFQETAPINRYRFRSENPLAYSKHVQTYQTAAISSASPLQLVVMLYDGALKFLKLAREAMEHRELYQQNDRIQKAQKIITELMSCLDMHQGGEIAQNLFALYSYCYNELVMANVEDNVEALDRAVKVLTDLRSSWVELEIMHRMKVQDQEDVSQTSKAA